MSETPPDRPDSTDDESTDDADLADVASDATYKVLGELDAVDGTGVVGHNAATTGSTRGVEGRVDSADEGAAGVRGAAGATTSSGATIGVRGETRSAADAASGVLGEALSGSGGVVGVYGYTESTDGYGVLGWADASDGTNYGVYGISQSSSGYAVFADGDAEVTGTLAASERSVDRTGVSLYQDTAQSVSADSREVLAFDASAYDDRGSYDLGNDVYTAPVDGRYRVTLTTMLLATGIVAIVSVDVNGTRKAYNQHAPSGATDVGYPNPCVSKTFDLAAGDEIEPYVFNNSGSTVDTQPGEEFTYMTIEQVA